MGLQRLIDHFEAQAAECLDEAALHALLDDVARELGFDFFALLHHSSLTRGGERLIRIDSYPSDWCRELVEQGLAADDPVHAASARTCVGFRWDRLETLVPLSHRQRSILARSRRHGIGPGYTVPAHVPGEPAGTFSFAVRLGRELPAGRLLSAEQIGAHAFDVARRLRGYPLRPARPHLSPRQVECVRLVASGKTDWEIGRILGISEETVHQYVKSARVAYDVVTRTQLVVHALSEGAIGFEEAGLEPRPVHRPKRRRFHSLVRRGLTRLRRSRG